LNWFEFVDESSNLGTRPFAGIAWKGAPHEKEKKDGQTKEERKVRHPIK
jgi:hypothetical protein